MIQISPSSMKPNMSGLNQTGFGASSPETAALRSGRAGRSGLVLDLLRAIAPQCSGEATELADAPERGTALWITDSSQRSSLESAHDLYDARDPTAAPPSVCPRRSGRD